MVVETRRERVALITQAGRTWVCRRQAGQLVEYNYSSRREDVLNKLRSNVFLVPGDGKCKDLRRSLIG